MRVVSHVPSAINMDRSFFVYDQYFYGGLGVVDGERGSSERCLKWGGGVWRVIRDFSKTSLKQGVGKGETCS